MKRFAIRTEHELQCLATIGVAALGAEHLLDLADIFVAGDRVRRHGLGL